jgi:hypothetical protein
MICLNILIYSDAVTNFNNLPVEYIIDFKTRSKMNAH